MPLPKPSKLVSKRFKKFNPPTVLPHAAAATPWSPPSSPPSREWCIRLICTDPDATDDSSADEEDPLPPSSSSSSSSSASLVASRKRLIHEIRLPLPASPSPSPPVTPNRRRRGRSPSRGVRSLCRRFGSSPKVQTGTAALILEAASAAVSAAAVPENCGGASLSPSPSPPSADSTTVTEEEFSRFLAEFLPEQEDTGDMWDYDLGGSGSRRGGRDAEMLDLELDTEALSWINSMQRFP